MKSAARFIVLVFAIAAVLAMMLLWKKRDREKALETLRVDYEADLSISGDDFYVGCDHEKLIDLTQFARLVSRVGEPTMVDLTGAPELRSLKGAMELESLRTLVAIDCPKLTSADGLAGHPALRDLAFTESSALVDVEAIRDLPNLLTLDLSGCEEVEALDVSRLPSLENLYLSRCRSLRTLDISTLSGLKQLYLDGCSDLAELEGLEVATGLTDLDVSNATSLTGLPGVEALVDLVVLDIRNVAIEDFSGIGQLSSLRVLRMGGQDAIETLEPFAALESLREIHLEACPNFRSVRGIPSTVNQYAGFTHCPKLISLEGIEAAAGIEQLDVTGCMNLADISPIAELKNLLQLSLVKCRRVTEIDFIEDMPELVIVALGGSGVVPAAVEDLEPANPDIIFDFEVSR